MIRDIDRGPIITDSANSYVVMRSVLFSADHFLGDRKKLLRSNLPSGQAKGKFHYGLAVVPQAGKEQAYLRLHAIDPRVGLENLDEALGQLEMELEIATSGFYIARQGILDLGRSDLAIELVAPRLKIDGTGEAMFEIFDTQHRGRDFHPYINE